MKYFATITPRDPLIARDSRPFGAGQGNRMRSLEWPYPSVVAGVIRTMVGKAANIKFNTDMDGIAMLKDIAVGGPLPLVADELFFPVPGDLLVNESRSARGDVIRKALALRPIDLTDGEGMNMPIAGLVPVAVEEEVKATDVPAFCSTQKMCEWLSSVDGGGFQAPPHFSEMEPNKASDNGFLSSPVNDTRTHVSIDPKTGAHLEGMLFMTSGLDFTAADSSNDVTIAARVEADNSIAEHLTALEGFHSMGGERRLVNFEEGPSAAWDCPEELGKAISGSKKIRMVLATPAIFENGWIPGWLSRDLKGSPPGLEGKLELKLVSACVSRWQPISGWSLEKGKTGEKPMRRLVPAGSVYFFEATGDTGLLAGEKWLQSVAGNSQDEKDGFGLALWGVW